MMRRKWGFIRFLRSFIRHDSRWALHKNWPSEKITREDTIEAQIISLSDLPLVSRHAMKFTEVTEPITELVTKFGGQPVWLQDCEWPIGQYFNAPMSFVGQIRIDKELFPNSQAEMAYVFMTDGDIETNEPDGGENAIILQPGDNSFIETVNITDGPSLAINRFNSETKEREAIPTELSVRLEIGEEYDINKMGENEELTKEHEEECYKLSASDKIGGVPDFIQYPEVPDETEEWQFFMQLGEFEFDSSFNLGDWGLSYSYINKTGTRAKLLWQCH